MDRRSQITKSFLTSLILDVSSKWASYVLKRQSLEVKRDPHGHFLSLTSEETNDSEKLVDKMIKNAGNQEKIPFNRVEIFVSNIIGQGEIKFWKKGNETVASPYFATGLLGVLADENLEIQNLTGRNSVFIFKCRKNHLQYKRYVNCDILVVNMRSLLDDFQRIEVVAGSSYILEPCAIYFWCSMSYCHVIVHKRQSKNISCQSSDSVDDVLPCSSHCTNSPTKSSAVSQINNELSVKSRRSKRLRSDNEIQNHPTLKVTKKNSSIYVVDDEIHVLCDDTNVEGNTKSEDPSKLLKEKIEQQTIIIDLKDQEIEKLKAQVDLQDKELKCQKHSMQAKEKEIKSLKNEVKALEENLNCKINEIEHFKVVKNQIIEFLNADIASD